MKKFFFIFIMIFFSLIPLALAQNISIDNYNWTERENKIKIDFFNFTPDYINFNYPKQFTYKSISQIDNKTYEAVFISENSTESGNYSFDIKTNLLIKSFTISYAKPFVNISEPEIINKTEEEEKEYPFGWKKDWFWTMVFFMASIVFIGTVLIIIAEMNRRRK